jgi:hypothetical protein
MQERCKRGHPLNRKTIRIDKRPTTLKGGVVKIYDILICKACENERRQRSKRKQRDAHGPVHDDDTRPDRPPTDASV